MRKLWFLRGMVCLLAYATCLPLAHAAPSEITILVTHPRASVLHYYATLVREHVLDVANVRIVGIYHDAETEDYSESEAYLKQQNLPWMSLRSVHCPLHATDIFKTDNPCRNEFRDLVEHASAIVFNGGPDIPPSIYGRPQLLTTQVETPHRHYFEIALLANLLGTSRNQAITPLLASRPDFAILGICVGMQSLNVADGGTLVQDIPSEIYGLRTVEDIEQADPRTWHRSLIAAIDPEPGVANGVFHPILLNNQAPQALRMLSAGGTQVLSIHHQGVLKLGPDYLITATSLDGKVVEGIRHKHFVNVVGWQFHPERPYLWSKEEIQRQSEDSPESNFAFSTLQKDSRSRAFNLAIWQVFANAVLASHEHEGAASTH